MHPEKLNCGATHWCPRCLVFLLELHLHLITFAAELQTTLCSHFYCFLERIFSSQMFYHWIVSDEKRILSMSLRITWQINNFTVDEGQGFVSWSVAGRFRTSNDLEESKEKGKSMDLPKETKMDIINAAKEILASWKEMWEANPKSLASVLRFVYVGISWPSSSCIRTTRYGTSCKN